MTVEEIESFIENNESNVVHEYFDSLIQKHKDLNASNNWLSFLMLIAVFVYFFIDSAEITEVNLGLISITNTQTIKLFSPVIFSFLLFVFATVNAHRAEILKTMKVLGAHLFHLDKKYDASHMNSFLRLITPFSFWDEVNSKFTENGKVGCLTLFLTLPLYPIILAPFVFEYHVYETHFLDLWPQGLFEKGMVVLNSWFVLAVFVYYVKLMAISLRTVKIDIKNNSTV